MYKKRPTNQNLLRIYLQAFQDDFVSSLEQKLSTKLPAHQWIICIEQLIKMLMSYEEMHVCKKQIC